MYSWCYIIMFTLCTHYTDVHFDTEDQYIDIHFVYTLYRCSVPDLYCVCVIAMFCSMLSVYIKCTYAHIFFSSSTICERMNCRRRKSSTSLSVLSSLAKRVVRVASTVDPVVRTGAWLLVVLEKIRRGPGEVDERSRVNMDTNVLSPHKIRPLKQGTTCDKPLLVNWDVNKGPHVTKLLYW